MPGRFVDRCVLVTGAGSGIGRATAQLFAAEGARVAAVDQNEADVEKTVAPIKDSGGDALAVAADVSLEADCRGLVERAVAAYGKLNVAFNNAGVGASGLMLALLALCPIRLKNFAALEIGTSFRLVKGRWWIVLPGPSTKIRRHLRLGIDNLVAASPGCVGFLIIRFFDQKRCVSHRSVNRSPFRERRNTDRHCR
jgi:hypothetical protein